MLILDSHIYQMHSLHAQGQGGCWGENLPAGHARQAASAHDLDAEAKRSHLPKGETARSYGHTIHAL